LTWRRVYALIEHHYPGKDVNKMTEIQVQNYISQIQWVSPLERIRYYLRDIKHVLFSFLVEDYQAKEELGEDETVEMIKERELAETQRQAILHGIKPPLKRG
jgi:hypothetical protein